MRNRTHNKVWRRYEGKRMYNDADNTQKNHYYVDLLWCVIKSIPIGEVQTIDVVGAYKYSDSTQAKEHAERLNRTQ